MTRFRWGVALVVLAAGCSSGGSTASTSSAAATIAAAPATPETAAIALGRHLLDDVRVPAGARLFAGAAPTGLGGPQQLEGVAIPNVVYSHRLWTVDEAPHEAWQWISAHLPRGFVAGGAGSITQGRVRTWTVAADLAVTPANVSSAALQYEIGGAPSGPAVVRVDSVVGWTNARPAAELVPPTDRSVAVTIVHIGAGSPAAGTPGRRVVTADPSLVQPLVRTFNRLRVLPPPSAAGGGCPGPGTIEYRVEFSPSSTARPDVVATVGRCGAVVVTRNGVTATELDDQPQQAFASAAAKVVGFTAPHFG